MTHLSRFGLAAALSLWIVPANAQTSEVPNTPRAMVQETAVGVWAEDTSIGTCIVIAIKQGESWVRPRGPIGCKSTEEIQKWPGGVAAYIETIKTDINRQLASIFPPNSGKSVITQINGALNKSFKLQDTNGSVELKKR